MEGRKLFYVKTDFHDFVVSFDKAGYGRLLTPRPDQPFPKLRWSKIYAAVEDCDYITDEVWQNFILSQFLKTLKSDADWNDNYGCGYTWLGLFEVLQLNDSAEIVATLTE